MAVPHFFAAAAEAKEAQGDDKKSIEGRRHCALREALRRRRFASG